MSARKRPAALCPETLPLPLEPLSVRIPIAVRLTGISRSKLYQLIRDHEVEIVKIGSSTLVRMDSLRRLIDKHAG